MLRITQRGSRTEYRVYAPAKATGDVLDWLENCFVRVSNGYTESESPNDSICILQAVRQELERAAAKKDTVIMVETDKRKVFVVHGRNAKAREGVALQQRSSSSNSTEILASTVQAVAVLVVNLRPIGTEVFVHLNSSTINPCSRVECPLFIPIYVPVMSPYSVKIFSGYQAFENCPVSTL
jgi:hypothetical protein